MDRAEILHGSMSMVFGREYLLLRSLCFDKTRSLTPCHYWLIALEPTVSIFLDPLSCKKF